MFYTENPDKDAAKYYDQLEDDEMVFNSLYEERSKLPKYDPCSIQNIAEVVCECSEEDASKLSFMLKAFKESPTLGNAFVFTEFLLNLSESMQEDRVECDLIREMHS